MDWSHTELANLLHFPDGEDKIYQLPETGDRPYIKTVQEQSRIADDEFTEGLYVGHLVDKRGNPVRPIRIPYPTWTYMSFGAGETGSGKTALILNMLYDHLDHVWYQDPDAPGATFIDPKGEDAYKLLAKINADLKRMEREGMDVSKLKERIHFFDLASDRYVLGLNLLHKNEWETNDDVANNVLDLLKNAYKSESMLLDKFGQMAIHALLLDRVQHNILGMEQILRRDPTFRNRILPRVKGTIFETDWKESKEELKTGKVAQPVLNRLQKIRLNTRMRRIFGQANMGLHAAKWMDEGHLVIFSCAGLSETERKLVMGFIITQYHQQAQRRKRKSKIHLHICDEFHLVQIPIIKKIYAIDRYTGHCFVPMTQYADQIEEDILEAFDGNVTTYIACNQGSRSAKAIHEMSRKAIDADEIQRLEKLTAVISTKNKNGERVTLKVKTPPPYFFKEDGQPAFYGPETDIDRHEREYGQAMAAARRFAEELMERDCGLAEEVDQWIARYLSPKTVLEQIKEQRKTSPEDNAGEEHLERQNEDQAERNEPENLFTPLF
jgi:hypothetical protein